MILEFKLSYKIHLQSVFSRVSKAIGLFRKLQPTLMRHSMVTKQISFIRTYLDYGDVVSNQASDKLCHQGLESLQQSTAIVILGQLEDHRLKFFQELGLETLKSRWWQKQICCFVNWLKKNHLLIFFFQKITLPMLREVLKKVKSFFPDKNNLFQNSLFPAVIMEWINVNICHSASCNIFKKVILKIIRPNVDTNVDSSEGLKLLTRIRLGLCHLANHKFRHILQD